MKKVLITDDVHPSMIDAFKSMHFEVDYLPEITYEQTREIIHQYAVLIVNTKIRVDKDLIDRGKHLQCVGRVGSGMEHIDTHYAAQRHIGVFSAPEGNANAVAEHALGLLLALLNNICRADSQIRNGIWRREENRGVEIEGKTIGIVGFGNTGSAFAKKLSGFDCTVLAYDKYKSGFGNTYIKEVDLNRILAHADIISFHVPLTSETKYMVNASFIASTAKPFYLVNTSRGGVVNTAAILDALQSGKLVGAALDVFENENYAGLPPGDKKIFDKLAALENVIMTPHIAGWTVESKLKLTKILVGKIREYLS